MGQRQVCACEGVETERGVIGEHVVLLGKSHDGYIL